MAGFAGLSFGLILLIPQNFIGNDGVYYARVGASLLAGRGICANPGIPYLAHPPFYPLLIGLFNLIFRNLEFSGHFVSILAYAATIFPLYSLASRAYSKATAYWVTLLYLTNGFLLIHVPFVTADMPFTFLVYAGVAVLYPIVFDSAGVTKRILVWSILMGLAHLTRPEGLFFWMAGAAAVQFLLPRPCPASRRVFLSACSLGVFLCFFVPYGIFVQRQSHQLQLSGGVTENLIRRQMDILPSLRHTQAKKIYFGLTRDKTRLKMDELIQNFSFWQYLRKEDFSAVRTAVHSLYPRLWDLAKYWYAGFGFILAGFSFLGGPWDTRRKKIELLFFLCLATLLLKLLSQFVPRYFIPYFPILLLWNANGIEVFRRWSQRAWHLTESVTYRLALAFCLLLAVPSVWYLHRTITEFPISSQAKELGFWMRENLPSLEREAVVAGFPAVNFYSGTKILNLPYVDSVADLRIYMAYQRARYLVVSSDLARPFDEAYRPFLDEKTPLPAGFERKKIIAGRQKIFLYELSAVPNQNSLGK